jgi:hypothetical protein
VPGTESNASIMMLFHKGLFPGRSAKYPQKYPHIWIYPRFDAALRWLVQYVRPIVRRRRLI